MGRGMHHFKGGGRGRTAAWAYKSEARDFDRRVMNEGPRPGLYPKEGILTPDEVVAYRSGDHLECLLCGRIFERLGTHLRQAHDVDVKDYCERYGIPWRWRGRTGLTGVAWGRRQSATLKAVPGLRERVSKIHKLSPMVHRGGPGSGPGAESLRVRRGICKTKARKCPVCNTIFRPGQSGDGVAKTCSPSCGQLNREKATTCARGHPKTPEHMHRNKPGCRTCFNMVRRAWRQRRRAEGRPSP